MPYRYPAFHADQTLPTPAELKELTSLSALHKRPQEMIDIDKAYEKYYEIRRSILTSPRYRKSLDKSKSLFEAWTASKHMKRENHTPQVLYGALNVLALKNSYLGKKDWTDIERNKDRVLERLHNYIINEHAELVGDIFLPRSLVELEIPMARLGVLYLFSNIHVELNVLAAVTGAVNTVLDSVLDFDYIGDVLEEAKLDTGLSIRLDEVKNIELSADKVVAAGVNSGNFIAQRLANKKLLNLSAMDSTNLGRSDSKWEINSIDRFNSPVRARSDASADLFNEPTRARSDGGVDAFADLYNQPTRARANSDADLHQVVRSTKFQRVWAWVKNNFYNLCKYILEKFYWVGSKVTVDNGKKLVETAFKSLAKVGLKKLLEFLLKNLSDLAGSIVDTLEALGKFLVEGYKVIKTRSAVKKLKINPGHPQLIINSLVDATDEAFKGAGIDAALSAMKTALLVSLTIVSAGTSNLVTPIVSTIVSTLKWFYDAFKLSAEKTVINNFAKRAKISYEEAKGVALGESIGVFPKKGGICFKLDEFIEFFNEACEVSSILPLLAFRSGIVGDVFVFIRLLNDRGESMIDSENENSKNYIMQQSAELAKLKDKALIFLKDSGLSFSSSDAFITGVLGMALATYKLPDAAPVAAVTALAFETVPDFTFEPRARR